MKNRKHNTGIVETRSVELINQKVEIFVECFNTWLSRGAL